MEPIFTSITANVESKLDIIHKNKNSQCIVVWFLTNAVERIVFIGFFLLAGTIGTHPRSHRLAIFTSYTNTFSVEPFRTEITAYVKSETFSI